MSHSDCDSLFEASKALLGGQNLAFVPMYPGDDDSEFEEHWKKELEVREIYGLGVVFGWSRESGESGLCVQRNR